MKLFRSFAPAVASLTGYASAVTGAGPWTPTTAVSGDGLAHTVTIQNNTATNHSAKTLTVTGTDANGVLQTETLAAPNTSATVTTAKFYQTLTTVAVSSTIGADTFNLGWSQVSVSPDILLNPDVDYLSVFEAVVTATINFDLEGTLSAQGDQAYSAVTWNNDGNWTAKTASVTPATTSRWRRIRLAVNTCSGTPAIVLYGAIPGL